MRLLFCPSVLRVAAVVLLHRSLYSSVLRKPQLHVELRPVPVEQELKVVVVVVICI